MKFNLYLLADHLKMFNPYFVDKCSLELRLQSVLLVQKDARFCEGHVYLLPRGKEQLMDLLDPEKNLSFILFEESLEKVHVPANWDVMYISSSEKLIDVYESIVRAVTELNAWYVDFLDAIISPIDLQEQMDIAVRYLKNPLALFDMSISLITWAGSVPDDLEDPVWKGVLTKGYSTVEAFPKTLAMQISESIGKEDIVIVPPMDEQAELHNMMATLFHDDHPFACLAMNELCQSFDKAEYSYVLLIKKCLEQSPVLLRHFALQSEGGDTVFQQLLGGIKVEGAQMSLFLRSKGWASNDEFRLYLFRFHQEKKLNKNSFQAYYCLISGVDPSLDLFYFENSIIAIERESSSRYSDTDRDFRIDKREHLSNVQQQIDMLVGVSMKYQGYHNLNYAMLQAKAAWQYANDRNRIVWYEDIAQQYIADRLNAYNNLPHYCHPSLLRFNTEDEWDNELMDTLTLYLKNGKRVSKTADMLHIHRNTLLNRLRIIDEVLKINLGEMKHEEEVLLMLSCVILEKYKFL